MTFQTNSHTSLLTTGGNSTLAYIVFAVIAAHFALLAIGAFWQPALPVHKPLQKVIVQTINLHPLTADSPKPASPTISQLHIPDILIGKVPEQPKTAPPAPQLTIEEIPLLPELVATEAAPLPIEASEPVKEETIAPNNHQEIPLPEAASPAPVTATKPKPKPTPAPKAKPQDKPKTVPQQSMPAKNPAAAKKPAQAKKTAPAKKSAEAAKSKPKNEAVKQKPADKEAAKKKEQELAAKKKQDEAEKKRLQDKAEAEKKRIREAEKQRQQEIAAAHAVKEKKMQAALENLAKTQITGNKVKASSSSVNLQSTSIPKEVGALQVDAFPLVEASGSGKWGSSEVSYSGEVAFILKSALRLPDYGAVKIKLTIDSKGKVLKVETLHSESNKNKTYAESKIPALPFPAFKQRFEGASQNTFVITLQNDS